MSTLGVEVRVGERNDIAEEFSERLWRAGQALLGLPRSPTELGSQQNLQCGANRRSSGRKMARHGKEI